MTPDQADDGVVELGLPDGGRVLVSFGAQVSGDPDVESGIVLALLDASDNEGDVCESLAERARSMGLRAVVSDDRRPVMVRVDRPLGVHRP
jgi:hypothetical protein